MRVQTKKINKQISKGTKFINKKMIALTPQAEQEMQKIWIDRQILCEKDFGAWMEKEFLEMFNLV
jgi:hypothetical protein